MTNNAIEGLAGQVARDCAPGITGMLRNPNLTRDHVIVCSSGAGFPHVLKQFTGMADFAEMSANWVVFASQRTDTRELLFRLSMGRIASGLDRRPTPGSAYLLIFTDDGGTLAEVKLGQVARDAN